MAGGVPLTEVVKECLCFLAQTGTAYHRTEFMSSLAATDQCLDRAINAHLPRQRDRFTLCGYGLAEGVYEQQLAARLAERGTTVELFGYDPGNPSFARQAIHPWTPATCGANASPLFDIVLARWVLHHVTPAQRWDALAACVRCCKPGASLLIVEEGPFSAEKNSAILLYEFLAGCADVLVNFVIYPDWLGRGDCRDGHYYLNYLTPSDIAALEAACFPVAAQRHLEWLQAGFFPQILIRYTLEAGTVEA
jgi:hypothetical protein